MAIRIFQDGSIPRWPHAAILTLIEPEIPPFDLLIQKNLTRTKHDVDRMICCGDKAIRNSTYHEECIWDPHLREGEVVGVIDRTNGKSDGGFLYGPIVTIALSLTFRPQFSIECLRRSIQQGWVTLDQNFWAFPLE